MRLEAATRSFGGARYLRLLVRMPPTKSGMCVTVPAFTDEIPLFLLLGVLGRGTATSNSDLYSLIVDHISRWARKSTQDESQHRTVIARVRSMLYDSRIPDLTADNEEDGEPGERMLDFIANEVTKERTPERRQHVALRALSIDLLPHLGTTDDLATRARKFTFVCMMAAQGMLAYCSPSTARIEADDRDHWRHKRLDTCGALIAMLFRQLWRNQMRSFEVQLKRAIDSGANVRSIDFLNSRKAETGVKYHFSTGVWSVMRGVDPSACSGVCQAITRMSRVAAISSLRRINCPVNRQGKTSMPRMLHRSDYGHVCATETPEGSACGLILNLPLAAHCRIGSSTKLLGRLLNSLVGELDEPTVRTQKTEDIPLTVFISGLLRELQT